MATLLTYSNLAVLGSIAVALAVYKGIDYQYGSQLRLWLLPRRYTIWKGTEQPPRTTWSTIWKAWKKATRLGVDQLDMFDDILGPVFDETGTTFRQEPYFFATLEPQNVQAMLATQFKDFETGKLRRGALRPLLGDSIFTSDGSFWEHSRALFRPQFSRENINDLDATDSACQALIDACGYTDTTGWTGEVALAPLFFNFTLDTATEFLFGESVGSQDSAIKKARGEALDGSEAVTTSQQFLNALDLANKGLISRTRVGIWYWLVGDREFRNAVKVIREWADGFVELALQSSTESSKEPGKKTNLLSSLVTQCRDRDELRAQTLAILFAGRDTTASLLSWLFAELSLHPDIFQQLRKVVLADFPVGSTISFSQLKSCRYMQHVIQETLRLHPTVPANSRMATRDTTLPVGGGPDGQSPIAIRKGSMVGYLVYLMHRRKDLWGEDALEFKPERWEQRIPAWQYLPFSGGPRICLGQQFAITETSYVLVRMLQQFDQIEPVDRLDMAKLQKDVGLTMGVLNKVKVRLHKADS